MGTLHEAPIASRRESAGCLAVMLSPAKLADHEKPEMNEKCTVADKSVVCPLISHEAYRI